MCNIFQLINKNFSGMIKMTGGLMPQLHDRIHNALQWNSQIDCTKTNLSCWSLNTDIYGCK